MKYRDLSRAIKAHPSPRLSEASDSGAFGGAGCFVLPVDSLPLELGVADLIVVRYILVLFDPVVSLRVLVEPFEGAACISVVVLVLAGCVVFIVDGIGLSVSVRLVWWFDFGRFDVGVGVHVSPGTVKWNQLKPGFHMIADDGRIVGSAIVAIRRGSVIGHLRYINILTWLRGFQDKYLHLVVFSLYPSLF